MPHLRNLWRRGVSHKFLCCNIRTGWRFVAPIEAESPYRCFDILLN